MATKIGTCRLCSAVGELRNSHIMPRWAFRRLIRFGPDPQPILIENGTRRSTGDQDTEFLLCGLCEQRFGRWEKRVAQLALQTDGSSPALEAVTIHGRREPGKEAEAAGAVLGDEVAWFAASIAWRASVSSRPEVDLGPYAEEFRLFLLGGATRLEHARLIVHVIDPKTSPPAAKALVHPWSFPTSTSGCRELQFGVPGLHFTFYVGGAVPVRYDNFCFMQTKKVWVIDGRDLERKIETMFRKATPLGKQRRR